MVYEFDSLCKHAQLFGGASGQMLGPSLYLIPYFRYASSEDSGKTAKILRFCLGLHCFPM